MNGIEREEMVKQTKRNEWGWAARAWKVHNGISEAPSLSVEKVKSHPSRQVKLCECKEDFGRGKEAY